MVDSRLTLFVKYMLMIISALAEGVLFYLHVQTLTSQIWIVLDFLLLAAWFVLVYYLVRKNVETTLIFSPFDVRIKQQYASTSLTVLYLLYFVAWFLPSVFGVNFITCQTIYSALWSLCIVLLHASIFASYMGLFVLQYASQGIIGTSSEEDGSKQATIQPPGHYTIAWATTCVFVGALSSIYLYIPAISYRMFTFMSPLIITIALVTYVVVFFIGRSTKTLIADYHVKRLKVINILIGVTFVLVIIMYIGGSFILPPNRFCCPKL